MSEIYEKLRDDVKATMKARDTDKLTALRTLDGAIQRVAIDENREIDDELVEAVIRRAVKDLVTANEQFEKGGRSDLIEKNQRELGWLEVYLPAQLDAAAVEAIIDKVIAESGAASKRDMGKVMGALKQRTDASQIDFGMASRIARGKLN